MQSVSSSMDIDSNLDVVNKLDKDSTERSKKDLKRAIALSDSSIFEVLDRIKDKPHVLKNPIALYLLDLFHSSKKGESINRK